MSCYHPIYAVKIGVKENGKADLKMLGYRPDDRETYIEWHNHRYSRDALFRRPVVSALVCAAVILFAPSGQIVKAVPNTLFFAKKRHDLCDHAAFLFGSDKTVHACRVYSKVDQEISTLLLRGSIRQT